MYAPPLPDPAGVFFLFMRFITPSPLSCVGECAAKCLMATTKLKAGNEEEREGGRRWGGGGRFAGEIVGTPRPRPTPAQLFPDTGV